MQFLLFFRDQCNTYVSKVYVESSICDSFCKNQDLFRILRRIDALHVYPVST